MDYRLTNSIIDVTYYEISDMAAEHHLVAGQQYRITDYGDEAFEISASELYFAGNSFGLIVTADSSVSINENVCACSNGNSYFTDSKFESWEIKYSLDNDTDRFGWASTDHKGIIYYMKDEFGNECPYDFKNIQTHNGNEYVYTFGGTTDDSLTGNSSGNIICSYIGDGNKMYLTQTIMDASCCDNMIGTNSVQMIFGSGCCGNVLGNDCEMITLGDNCKWNVFGNACDSNVLGSDVCYTHFGNDCAGNTINGCSGAYFGNGCDSNTITGNIAGLDIRSGCYGFDSSTFIKNQYEASESAYRYASYVTVVGGDYTDLSAPSAGAADSYSVIGLFQDASTVGWKYWMD